MTGPVTSKAHDQLVADGNILCFHHHPTMFNFPRSNVARLLHHTIARRGKFNIDATLEKPDRCHYSNPMLTFAKYLQSSTVFLTCPRLGLCFDYMSDSCFTKVYAKHPSPLKSHLEIIRNEEF